MEQGYKQGVKDGKMIFSRKHAVNAHVNAHVNARSLSGEISGEFGQIKCLMKWLNGFLAGCLGI